MKNKRSNFLTENTGVLVAAIVLLVILLVLAFPKIVNGFAKAVQVIKGWI